MMPTPKMHYNARFQPANPETWHERFSDIALLAHNCGRLSYGGQIDLWRHLAYFKYVISKRGEIPPNRHKICHLCHTALN